MSESGLGDGQPVVESNARLSAFYSSMVNQNTKGAGARDTPWLLRVRHCLCRFWFCLSGNDKYKRAIRKRASRFGVNSRSKLDAFARIAFPLSFALFNILYWFYFLHVQS